MLYSYLTIDSKIDKKSSDWKAFEYKKTAITFGDKCTYLKCPFTVQNSLV